MNGKKVGNLPKISVTKLAKKQPIGYPEEEGE